MLLSDERIEIMDIKIEEELRLILDDPNATVPVTEDNYFKITKELLIKLKELIKRLDSLSEDEINSMDYDTKLQLSTYINNAERILDHGKVVD